jgi:hypothetical protein
MSKGRNIILILGGIGGAGAISRSIWKHYNNKKKDGRSYEFQKLLQKKLAPRDNVVDELFETDNIKTSEVKLNSDEIKQIANQVWDSWGYFNDNEEKVYSQLRLINTYSEYKLVAKDYIIISDGVSLDFDLKDRLSSSEYKIVQKIFDSYQN